MALAYTVAVLAAAGVLVAAVIDHYLQPHIPPLDSPKTDPREEAGSRPQHRPRTAGTHQRKEAYGTSTPEP